MKELNKPYEFVKTLCFSRNAGITIVVDVIKLETLTIAFNDLPVLGFWLVAFHSNYTIHDLQPGGGVHPIQKYKDNLDGYIKISAGATLDLVGDGFNYSGITGYSTNLVKLDHDRYYDFFRNPIYFPGKEMVIQFAASIYNFIAADIVWNLDFFMSVGYNMK